MAPTKNPVAFPGPMIYDIVERDEWKLLKPGNNLKTNARKLKYEAMLRFLVPKYFVLQDKTCKQFKLVCAALHMTFLEFVAYGGGKLTDKNAYRVLRHLVFREKCYDCLPFGGRPIFFNKGFWQTYLVKIRARLDKLSSQAMEHWRFNGIAKREEAWRLSTQSTIPSTTTPEPTSSTDSDSEPTFCSGQINNNNNSNTEDFYPVNLQPATSTSRRSTATTGAEEPPPKKQRRVRATYASRGPRRVLIDRVEW